MKLDKEMFHLTIHSTHYKVILDYMFKVHSNNKSKPAAPTLWESFQLAADDLVGLYSLKKKYEPNQELLQTSL